MPLRRWLGVDFSGNHAMWRAGCSVSNVWIADLRRPDDALVLHDLRRVQQLPGDAHPFTRLAALLRAGDFEAAGIDAPFSLPRPHVPPGGHAALTALVGASVPADRPFPRAADFVRVVTGKSPPLTPMKKPMRRTDTRWRGVNVRSTLWAGARSGAAMTSACLTLLERAARPMWPWVRTGPGLLVEAFPAGQLHTWDLPSQKYNGNTPEAQAVRTTILGSRWMQIDLGSHAETLAGSADALDAVLCAFAALAVATDVAPLDEDRSAADEGWIAVHPAASALV